LVQGDAKVVSLESIVFFAEVGDEVADLGIEASSQRPIGACFVQPSGLDCTALSEHWN
jgi:hypothetical protein